MKLKIDYIQDFIDSRCQEFKCENFVKKSDDLYTTISYPAKEAYIAEDIIQSILSDFATTKAKAFEDIYVYKDYTSLTKFGFYLGCPFYKITEHMYDEQISALKKDLINTKTNLSDNTTLIKIEQDDYKQLIQDLKTKHLNTPADLLRNICVKVIQEEHLDYLFKHLRATSGFIYYIGNICTKLENRIIRVTERANDRINELNNNIKELIDIEKIQHAEYNNTYSYVNNQIALKIELASNAKKAYEQNNIEDFMTFILQDSFYWFEFNCNPIIEYINKDRCLVVEYHLPNLSEIPNIKEIKHYKTRSSEIKYLSERELNKVYDDFIYNMTIRSIAEIFHFDSDRLIDTVMFNGRVESRNIATGQLEDNCILSIQVNRGEFEKIDLNYIDAKACFKHFKGIGASKLSSIVAVVPIMEVSRYDKRFRDSREVAIDTSTNLAAMHWEDFEHLIRELFEKEFSMNGGEVKVTQASRDGGVDAIAFDPDLIRGGKIVIQAKRYTNTVGVSAVRDLYGTVINEGANKGILITTSDYGSDSYSFAKGKPLTLLNGGHLLYLLEKHGEKARINIEEAKEAYQSMKEK